MRRLRVIVGGLIGRAPVGGWHYVQYLDGLARLGHEVYYHEDTWCWPYDPIGNAHTDDPAYSVRYLDEFFRAFAPAVAYRWHYRHLRKQSFGMDAKRFDEVARTADLFLNVGGACILPEALSPRCVKVFIDTDPGYNQIVMRERFAWSENVDCWCAAVAAHDRHFTYAENIRGVDCAVPDTGIEWLPTRPPVVPEMWQDLAGTTSPRTAWTTIMTWNPFKGPLLHAGREYRGKAPEFDKLIGLPRLVASPLRVAVGGTNAPLPRLAGNGWEVVDGPTATLTPDRYRDFVARSKGELSCAKEVYVALRTGWFSERTACYLASGRPAVVQDTGFSRHLGTGEGLLAFADADGARAGVERVEADYARHCAAAREVAREFFAADKVLGRMIEQVAGVRV